MATWAVPQFPRNQVDKSGFVLANEMASHTELIKAYAIINNWRASHAFPLNNFQVNLRAKVRRVQPDVLVAQRIKRLDSIKAKLVRTQTKTLQLSQMQDIGGCRAVLKSMANLRKIIAAYETSTFKHILKGTRDYIANPKADGYRGYHLIYQYQSLPNQISVYDKLRIEIQLRTALQHAWATAVEAVGTFTKQALKSNQGSDEWLRFFALMSAWIANIERTPAVPDTPADTVALAKEIKSLAERLHAAQYLGAYRATLDYIGKLKAKSSKYFLVHHVYGEKRVTVQGFAVSQSQQANLAYTRAESKKNEGDNIVLVSVDSIKALHRAYPNYFLDTEQFRKILDSVISFADENEKRTKSH
jgi:ppGpp synthetase/RelA/SpoT-type nucleotidyltranferase